MDDPLRKVRWRATALYNSPELQKRLAKFIVRMCFRDNTLLENIHADPGSRITQDEMRELMMACVDNVYAVIQLLFGGELGPEAKLLARMIETFTGQTDVIQSLARRDWNPEWAEPGSWRKKT